MSTRPTPACSGESAAVQAASSDQCRCADCQQFFPGGSLWCFPHGNICDDCKEQRTDAGLQTEAFGTSPRQASTPLRTAALPAYSPPEPQGSNRA